MSSNEVIVRVVLGPILRVVEEEGLNTIVVTVPLGPRHFINPGIVYSIPSKSVTITLPVMSFP